MDAKTRQCPNCKKDFLIEPEDFSFYKKIEVPPPTFCPMCRLQRRLVTRNERSLYFRSCDLCHKKMISRYSGDIPCTVYCSECWWSDSWDPYSYGKDYDFNKPFFTQFANLLQVVPRPNVILKNTVNCEFGNQFLNAKDCYMGVSVVASENINYGYRVDRSRDCFDSTFIESSEGCLETIYGRNCFNLAHSAKVQESFDSALLYNCRSCRNCILGVNQRNKSYEINNVAYTKEEYEKEKQRLDLGSYGSLSGLREKLRLESLKYPRRYAQLENCVNCTGDQLHNSKNALACFDSNNIENGKYLFAVVQGAKDCMDICFAGYGAELCYEGWSLAGAERAFFSMYTQPTMDVWYSDSCINLNSSFGCVGIRNGEYSILNKKHTKEEYSDLKQKIIEQMSDIPYVDSRGIKYSFGEFFPAELSLFAYNESQAQDYFYLSKEEALSRGYRWRDPEQKNYKVDVRSQDIPDRIEDASDKLVGQALECEHRGECKHGCSTAFRIIAKELDFYKSKNMPLPRICPNCRFAERMKEHAPLALWHRKCQCRGDGSENGVYKNFVTHSHGLDPCSNEFETTYAPDRPEIVYCEQCYNAEVA